MHEKEDVYSVSISRDIMIYGISVTIIFILLDAVQKAVNMVFGFKEFVLLMIGAGVALGCVIYLGIGFKFELFSWVQEGVGKVLWQNIRSGLFIGSITRLLISIADLIVDGFSWGLLVEYCIIGVLLFLSWPRIIMRYD